MRPTMLQSRVECHKATALLCGAKGATMTPLPRRALVFRVGGIEFGLRPGAWVLFGGIAALLDVAFLPLALPDAPALTHHVVALAMTVLMIVTTLLHESGHAIAYRLQGVWPVRITLRGSGGACAAVVYEDSPARGLVRALAGPAVTALIIAVLVLAWHAPALPPPWRLVAATVTVFSLFDLIFNALPVFPRGDGTHALRAVLWLLRHRAPEDFAVLYLWRPPILAAALLALSWAADRYLLWDTTTVTIAALCALALCAMPPLALVWRLLADHGLLPAPGRQGRV